MLHNQILSEHTKLTQEADSIRRKLASLPKGKLLFTSNGKYIKWFQSDGHTPTYIPKKNRALAEQLAYKKFLTLRLDAITKELRALDYYLRHHSTDAEQKSLDLFTTPGYSELLAPHFHPLSEELNTWTHTPFSGNPLHPEGLIHPAIPGLYVRSKSEVLIAMLLHAHKIPFRYEAPLDMNGVTFYPDFTIRHPCTGDYFYWEHFGMMDDKKYQQRASTKLEHYINNGIVPTIELITTYETRQHPLTSSLVEETIKKYFL